LDGNAREGIIGLIKFGTFKIIYSDYIPTYAPCAICFETPLYLRYTIDGNRHEVGEKINFFETDGSICCIYVWGGCVNIVNDYFNRMVTDLGKRELKKWFYKLFIFGYCENIIPDIYCKIKENLFLCL
jgi:hypothetical protein